MIKVIAPDANIAGIDNQPYPIDSATNNTVH
jgi:hypothetical protein